MPGASKRHAVRGAADSGGQSGSSNLIREKMWRSKQEIGHSGSTISLLPGEGVENPKC